MKLRTVMIFPEFENIEVIENIRKKYDPLAGLVRPHITLVFPFESDMTNEKLCSILECRLKKVALFELEMSGVSKQEDRFGNYLFLDVVKGKEELSNIHNLLYANEFAMYDLGLQYAPHITIGKLIDRQQMEDAYENIKDLKETFHTIVNKVSIEMIGENEESIIVAEIKLGYNGDVNMLNHKGTKEIRTDRIFEKCY